MDANAKAIWTNRLLNFIAACGVAVSALAAAAAEIGGVAEKLQALGVVPAKWASTAAAIAIVGHFAAKYSKTPSQAIAAAVPPGKAPAPPTGGAA